MHVRQLLRHAASACCFGMLLRHAASACCFGTAAAAGEAARPRRKSASTLWTPFPGQRSELKHVKPLVNITRCTGWGRGAGVPAARCSEEQGSLSSSKPPYVLVRDAAPLEHEDDSHGHHGGHERREHAKHSPPAPYGKSPYAGRHNIGGSLPLRQQEGCAAAVALLYWERTGQGRAGEKRDCLHRALNLPHCHPPLPSPTSASAFQRVLDIHAQSVLALGGLLAHRPGVSPSNLQRY
jgi:hypothetical protein